MPSADMFRRRPSFLGNKRIEETYKKHPNYASGNQLMGDGARKTTGANLLFGNGFIFRKVLAIEKREGEIQVASGTRGGIPDPQQHSEHLHRKESNGKQDIVIGSLRPCMPSSDLLA